MTSSSSASRPKKEFSHIKSKTRVLVEHVFGSQAQMGGHIVRTHLQTAGKSQDQDDESGLQHEVFGAADQA
ncbi:hypothetical protein [Sulfuriferula plumbiphila]|uniref:hypothetical protein n=1 Tax=Sulfuriferula plumbiphila TaxID=171865 RepID=UPI0011BD9B55|nr:hypothetical protein [Sulfuriferula plumbiphila]BBP03055.1 hypothetical protein SFPGR_04770 [Sulfuriferula plumbiphila]